MRIPLSKKFFVDRAKKGEADYALMGIVGLIIFFGLLFLSSASSVYSYKKFGSTYYVVFHQILTGLLPGIAAFYIFSKIDYKKYLRYTHAHFFISVALLLLVFIPRLSADYGTSRSWINIFGFSLQPSEFVKITFLIFLASWIQRKGYADISDFKRGFLPFLMYLSIISALMALQPDLGMLMVIAFMSLAVYFVAGAKFRHIGYMCVAGAIAFIAVVFNKPYIANRIKIFLHPSLDRENIGYQIYQAFLAIGSGGIFGKGFGKSAQKFSYLPEVSSDSIFAVIAEEMGFIVVVVLILLYAAIMYRGIMIAQRSPDPFGRFLAAGIVAWITIQTFLNIAVMTGLAPVTGVTLPFISAGGTSLVASLASIGILVNISKHSVE